MVFHGHLVRTGYGLCFKRFFWLVVVLAGAMPGLAQQRPPAQRPVQRAGQTQPMPSHRGAGTGGSQAASASVAKPNPVVAVVNQKTITRTDLARECIRRFGERVLESEINKHLILEACRQRQVSVTRQEVEEEVERMADKFGVSVERWLEMLAAERGIHSEQYRRDIIWPMLCLRKLAAESLEVTDEEIDKAYESEYGAMVQVRMIMSSTRDRAEKIHAQAAARPDLFDRLAKDYSEDENSAAARGLIPPVRRHVGDPAIEQVVFGLRDGEVSPVVEAMGQHFIFLCEHHIPPRDLDAAQVAELRLKLAEVLSDRKLRSVGSEIFRGLQDQAKIVNVFNDPKLRQEMPGVAALVNGQPVTLAQLGEQCIMRHGNDVLQAEIHRAILNQAMERRSLTVTKEEIDDEIRRAAEMYGFLDASGNPDIDAWLKHATKESDVSVDTYVRDAVWPSAALKKLVRSTIEISGEDLQKGFESNYGERVEVLAIVLSNQRTAHEVFDMARRNPTDKFFGELAHQYSIEPVSRANFGQVPPIRQWGGQPLVEREAFRLQPGEISGVLASGDKFIILRCLGRTKPVVTDLESVRPELERDIREKKLRLAMHDEFQRLQRAAQVDNFLDRSSHAAESAVVPASHASER